MGQGLNINTNISALISARVLHRSTVDLKRSIERLSSGLRINRAGDDAAGLAIAEGFRARVRGLAMAQRNTQDAIGLIQTAEGALGEIHKIFVRIRELALQAANGTLSATNRTDLDIESAQITEQIESIALQTAFNGINLLDGSTSNLVLQIGPDAGQTLVLNLPIAVAADLFFHSNIDTVSNAIHAIEDIDVVIRRVSEDRAALGAAQNRLEFIIKTLAVEEENLAAAESRIRDSDIAQESIRLTRNQILVSAGTSVLAQSSVAPQAALKLLG
jgi:flagellin